MSVSFLTPKALKNLRTASICFEFSNNDPVNLKKLTSSTCSLAASGTNSPSSCTGCSPTTYGLYFPKVASQTELNSNFSKISNTSFTKYCFFKEDENADWVLHETSDLSTGFEEASPVVAYRNEKPVGNVSETEFSTTTVTVRDGGNIIIGVLDTLGEEK